MKKILIVNKSFAVGGIQTALSNMLTYLSDKYDVDLLVFYDKGPIRERIPKNVRIIRPSLLVQSLGFSFSDIRNCRNLIAVIFRMFAAIWTRIFNNKLPVNIALATQKRLKGYDVAISYHHEPGKKVVVSGFTRFVDRCVEAKKKIGWIHYDRKHDKLDDSYIITVYDKMDALVFVTEATKRSFIDKYVQFKDKCVHINNFIDYERIRRMSLEADNVYDRKPNELIMFTACRLNKEKGILRGIKAIAPLMRKYKDIKWYIGGDGNEREKIEELIKAEKLEGRVILLGLLQNPYPYMREADIFLLLSEHEAGPMVINEAKALGLPVFSTRTTAAEEMIEDGFEGFICENSEEGIRSGLEKILTERNKIEFCRTYLKSKKFDNSESMGRITELFDGE